MGTVTGNRGTVLEHVALASVVSWASALSEQDDSVQYLDTHAMAPINRAIGDDYLTRLLEQVENDPITNALNPGVQAYCDALARSAQLRQSGSGNYYPTHFIHAALSAQASGRSLAAYLFENDGGGHPEFHGRRAEIEDFLRTPAAQTATGVQPDRFQGTLAPKPGNFRDPDCWATPAKRGSAMVVFNDPMGFTKRRRQRNGGPPAETYMDAADLCLLREQIDRVYLDQPRLTVQVIFVMSRHGRATLANYQAYFRWVAEAWRTNFVPGHVAREFSQCGGIKWALFLVFVGAYLNTTDEPQPDQGDTSRVPAPPPRPSLEPDDFADSFDKLLTEIEQTVRRLEPDAVTNILRE